MLNHPGQLFKDYAILGDDVIIADEAVAHQYSSALSRLGVNLSIQKSLISKTGAGEFAKRFRVRGMSVDLSPVSIKALKNFYNPYGLIAIDGMYSVKRFSTLCRVGGMGYKELSSLNQKRSRRFERVWQMRIKQRFPSFEWWLGRGYPLDP